MDRLSILKIACLVAVTLLATACTRDELADSQGVSLPEGMYPLTFTAIQQESVSAIPQTRVTDYDDTDGKHKSKWDGNEEISVQIGDGTVGTYQPQTDGTVTAKTRCYWKNTNEAPVHAWYVNFNSYPTDQTSGLAYVMKAKDVTCSYLSENINLEFTHQLAKIRVKLVRGTYEDELTGVTVKVKNAYTSCTINQGMISSPSGSGDIKMKEPAVADGYYEANIIPETTARQANVFEINEGTLVSLDKAMTFQAGYVYTITITVDRKILDITNITGTEYTVRGNVYLKGDSNPHNLKLKVEAGSKLILENVVLESTGIAIDCGGDATIRLSGKNKINSKDGAGIEIKNGTLIIDGSGELNVSTDGNNCCGIGASGGASIVINGGTIIATATNSSDPTWGSAAIGSAPYGECGDITINGGDIIANGGWTAAGIGSGVFGRCGNILIQGENTVVTAKTAGGNSAHIGAGDVGSCGTVTIKAGVTVNNIKYTQDQIGQVK